MHKTKWALCGTYVYTVCEQTTILLPLPLSPEKKDNTEAFQVGHLGGVACVGRCLGAHIVHNTVRTVRTCVMHCLSAFMCILRRYS